MRKTHRRTRNKPPITLMIIPMIDVIFLLLLFFTLMTSFEVSARVRVDIPKPVESQAHRSESAKRVVINCEYDEAAGGAPLYRMAADAPQPLEVISERLAAAAATTPELTVVIRADRRLEFEHIRRVMKVVARHGIEVMQVSALRESGG